MKKVLLALFLWGSINTAQQLLFANGIYHLPVLIDSNLNDSIALVNLFPGNSWVSITNPDSGRTEVFTVQQRKIIGRKIALSPEASSRLELGEGSIAEVRIVQLALNGNNAEVNPAVEYKGIIASPVETTDILPRAMEETPTKPINIPENPTGSRIPIQNTRNYPPQNSDSPNGFTDSVETQALSTIPKNGEAELFTESAIVTGLPPRAEIPPVAQTPAEEPFAPKNRQYNRESQTSPPSYKHVPSRNTPPQEIEKPRLNIIAPTAKPNPNELESIQEADEPLLIKDITSEEPKPALEETIPPRSDAGPTPFRGFADKDTAKTETTEGKSEARSRPGDLIPTPSKKLSQNRPSYEAPENSSTKQEWGHTPKTANPPQPSNIPKKPEIYFPTIADMNPPPSGSLNRIPRIVPKRSTPAEPNDATIETSPSFEPDEKQPTTPSAMPSAGGTRSKTLDQILNQAQPSPVVATRIPQKIVNLNNLHLPDGYYIQLASFQDILKTRQVYERFTNKYKMNVVPANINGKKYYRCLIGNLNESQVTDILRRVRIAGYKDAFVYRNR